VIWEPMSAGLLEPPESSAKGLALLPAGAAHAATVGQVMARASNAVCVLDARRGLRARRGHQSCRACQRAPAARSRRCSFSWPGRDERSEQARLQGALRREAEKRERALLLEAQELRRQAVRQERERSVPELAQHIRCAYARLAAQHGWPALADGMELPDQLSSRVYLCFTIRSFQDALRDKCKVAVASATTGAAGAP
jgi:hypothetical protein